LSNIGGHDIILHFVCSIKMADDELGIRECLKVVGPSSVAELYPRNEGFMLGLIVRCFEHDLEGMVITRSDGVLNDKAGFTAIFSGRAVRV